MWKFLKRAGRDDDRFRSLDKAVDDLATCCSNAHDSIRNLETRIKTLDADVSLMWEKTNRALNRFAKRESRSNEGNGETTPARTNVDEINRRILDGEPL